MRALIGLALWMAVGVGAAAMTPFHHGLPDDQPFDKLSTTWVSPHIPIAKPLYDRPLRVLTLAPLMRQRETVELAQRLDMQYGWMFTSSMQSFAGDYFFLDSQETLQRNLRELAPDREYDVILVGPVNWNGLPRALREAIASRVVAGTGLVVCHWEGVATVMRDLAIMQPAFAPPTTVEVALDDLQLDTPATAAPIGLNSARGAVLMTMSGPEMAVPGIAVTSATFGQGRVLSVFALAGGTTNSGIPAFGFATPLSGDRRLAILYDFHLATLARGLVWAANREPPANVSWSREQRRRRSAAELSAEGLPLQIVRSEAAVGLALHVEVSIYDELRRLVERQDLDVGKTAQQVVMPVKPLPAGRQLYAVARLLAGEKVLSWDVTVLHVESASRLTGVTVPRTVASGKSIEVTGTVEGAQEGERLWLELWDNRERLLEQQEIPMSTTVTASLPSPVSPLTTRHYVVARLQRHGVTVWESEWPVDLQMPKADEYRYIIWTEPWGYAYRDLLWRRYDELGVDGVLTTFRDFNPLTANNLRGILYATRIAPDAETPQAAAKRMQQEAVAAAAQAAGGLDLLEDPDARDPTLQLDGLAQEKRQKSTAASAPTRYERSPCLNDPAWREQIAEKIAGNAKTLLAASPLAFTLGDENNLAGTCNSPHCTAAFRQWLQAEYQGDLATLNTAWQTAFTRWDEVDAPDAPPAPRNAKATGWYDRQRFNDWTYDESLRHCRDAALAVDPTLRVGFTSNFDSRPGWGYDLTQNFRWANFNFQYHDPFYIDHMRAFGPADLLGGETLGTYSGRKHALEYTVYPWASFFQGATGFHWWRGMGFTDASSALDPGYEPLPSFGRTLAAAHEFKAGLYDLRRLWHWDDMGVWILYQQADMYAAYWEAGNAGPTAWRDHMGGLRNLLRHTGWGFDYVDAAMLEADLSSEVKLLLLGRNRVMSKALADCVMKYVEAGGTVAAEGPPAVYDETLRPQESALAALFTDLAPGERRVVGQGTVWRTGPGLASGDWAVRNAMWARIADSAMLDRGLTLLADGQAVQGWEVYRYRPDLGIGSARIIGLTARDEIFDAGVTNATLHFPEAVTLVDLRAGRVLGEGAAEYAITLDPARPLMLAALPTSPAPLEIAADREQLSAGQTMVIALANTGDGALPTVIRLEVAGPDSTALPYYTQRLRLQAGDRGIMRWETALNERPGAYRLLLTDLLTGREQILTVTVEQAPPADGTID